MSLDQHPDFPAGWDPDKVIPGELFVPDDLSGEELTDDDIPPGYLVPYEPSYPVLRKTGSAAMVVASVTGRAIGLSARGTGTTLRWFFTGAAAVGYLARRYIRTHDFQEAVGGIQKKSDWNQNKAERRSRWKILGWAAGVTVGLNLAGWWALVKYGELSAADSWWMTPATMALAAFTAVSWYGRYRINNPGIAPEQIIADQDNPDGEEPYPLAWVTDGGQAADCLGRALYAEGADYRDVKTLARHDWGWELEVVLKGSTPGKVMAAADQLESHLGLPDGGFMMEPDTRDKSRIIVRLVRSSPFADMPRPAVHAPRSLSVHDTIAMGRAMDGSIFELTLDGFCALVVGAMGAGKTLGALRTIAEALTACRDAVCYDLDPIKGGLAEFGDLMAKRGRTAKECEDILAEVLDYVSARRDLLPALGMGDRWHATEDHPNLYVFVDEFIQLTAKAKEDAITILRTGRQYGIYLVMAGQEATADALGDAIALIIAYRILMACRFEDIRIAFGPGAGAQGWRPDRMKPAVGPVANDAGQAMIMGGPFNRAIRYQFNAYTRDQITSAVRDRIEAGVNRMDADTLLKAGGKLNAADQRENLTDRLLDSDHPDAELIAALLDVFDQKRRDFLPTSEVLLPALAAAGFDSIDATALSNRMRKHAPGVKSDRTDCPEGNYLRGWQRDAVERAAAGLLDPAAARRGPGTRAA
jgi:S-DNA-T family DNA segregation ATPase FtsK/SpoIIIE